MRALPFALLFLLLAQPATAQEDNHAAAIDRLVRATLPAWKVPGLSLVIVHRDRVVALKGFGVKELGQPAPVTPDTVFPLASCTKPFTALALALLVDDGKLAWDDPVRRHLPDFHLADPLADANVTLRDLAAHRTGVGNHDPLWYHAPWSLPERLRKLARVKPAHGFREHFAYQTILFGAAGLAAGRAAEMPWEDLVQRRILEPLAMKTASCVAPTGQTIDLAAPHKADERGEVRRIARYPLRDPDPAGSLHASARDLGAFLRLQLGDGTWNGEPFLAARHLHEPQTAQIVLRLEGFARVMNPDTHFLTYGLGWIVQDYRGQRILMHGGAIDGFRAHFTLVPDAQLGIALLNNLDGNFMNLALSNAIIDEYLKLPPRDWSAYYLKLQTAEEEQARARVRKLRARQSDEPPALPLAAYVGAYDDPAYGTCRVTLRDGKLHWSWGNISAPLEPAGDNTFLVEQKPLVLMPIAFTADAAGQVVSVRAFERDFQRVRLKQ